MDDDAEIVGLVSMGLTTLGFEVLTAEDGDAGLYVARASRPDLMVLDLAMPRMHGYEVCQAVRADKDLCNLKIIVTSGKNYSVDIKTAKDLGANLYMVKPYGLRQLADAIQGLLNAALIVSRFTFSAEVRSMSVFTVRFWGTRGSIPSPGPRTQRYGGNTSCVEVRRGESLYILDAGTGIRELGDRLMKEYLGRELRGNLFITHTHWDHIQGFPFFVPAYVRGNRFRIHGAHGVGRSFEKIFKGLMDPNYFPVDVGDMSAAIEFIEVTGDPFDCDGVEVRTIFTNHPGVNLAYKFSADGKTVIYLTDHETYQTMNQVTEFARKQDRLIEDFCRGADLLICDAQYTDEEYRTKRTWGHSRYKDTIDLGLRAGVRRLVLHHHDPTHADEHLDAIAKDAEEIVRKSGKPMQCLLAQEGLQLEA